MFKFPVIVRYVVLLLFSDFALAQSVSSDQRRVELLESAIAPDNTKAAAWLWAKAVKERNGAVQYLLMCPALQKENLTRLENSNWVTGVSSPWVSDYRVALISKTYKEERYKIVYTLYTGAGIMGKSTDSLKIVRVDPKPNLSQSVCIDKIDSR